MSREELTRGESQNGTKNEDKESGKQIEAECPLMSATNELEDAIMVSWKVNKVVLTGQY